MTTELDNIRGKVLGNAASQSSGLGVVIRRGGGRGGGAGSCRMPSLKFGLT